jgi:hypothetical protein
VRADFFVPKPEAALCSELCRINHTALSGAVMREIDERYPYMKITLWVNAYRPAGDILTDTFGFAFVFKE